MYFRKQSLVCAAAVGMVQIRAVAMLAWVLADCDAGQAQAGLRRGDVDERRRRQQGDCLSFVI